MRLPEIGPYRVLRLIAHGGQGSVYVGHDQRLNRRVALKLIEIPAAREARARVVSEARHLAALNHRSIVQIFDVVEVRSHVVLVMEYVAGTDLQDLIEGAKPELAVMLHLVVDICAALVAAHQAGLIHRDLKPANVLIDMHGQIKLTDFGIAQTLPHAAAADPVSVRIVSGSCQCMSPEQAAGLPADARSDLFALGLMLYRLLSGGHPFAEAANDQLLLHQLQHQPHRELGKLVDGIPPALDQLVNSLLAKDPQARPASALDVRQTLLVILRDYSVPHDNHLLESIQRLRRSEDAIATSVELPSGFARGARSHLLPAREWGPWAINLATAWRQPLAIAMAVVLMTGLAAAVVAWRDARQIEVNVLPPQYLAEDDAAPPAQRLNAMLRDAIAARQRLQISVEPTALPLQLQVQCGALACSMQLIAEQGAGESDSAAGAAQLEYAVLLSGATDAVWESTIQRALGGLFD